VNKIQSFLLMELVTSLKYTNIEYMHLLTLHYHRKITAVLQVIPPYSKRKFGRNFASYLQAHQFYPKLNLTKLKLEFLKCGFKCKQEI